MNTLNQEKSPTYGFGEVAIGAKCARCWMITVLVGINYSFPDLCPRCCEKLEKLRSDDPTHPIWGINGTIELHHKNHPIRQLALDPTVPKFVRDGRVIEVWGNEEQAPWRYK